MSDFIEVEARKCYRGMLEHIPYEPILFNTARIIKVLPDKKGYANLTIDEVDESAFYETKATYEEFAQLLMTEAVLRKSTLADKANDHAGEMLELLEKLPLHWLDEGVLSQCLRDELQIDLSFKGTTYEATISLGDLRKARALIAKVKGGGGG